MEDGSTVDIGDLELDTNVYFNVTNTLTNCATSNSAAQVSEGGSYSATITANSGYQLSSVKVTMGGANVTASAVSGGNINITNVTGDIVITAVATEVQSGPSYTNLADPTSSEWMDGHKISSSGVVETASGTTLMNTIPCVKGDIVRVKGATTIIVAMYKDNTFYKRATVTSPSDQYTNPVVNGDYTEFGIAYAGVTSIRAYGTLSGTAEDVIITVNEPIE
jgi:formylmethanofuran dehydrogenase subunit D